MKQRDERRMVKMESLLAEKLDVSGSSDSVLRFLCNKRFSEEVKERGVLQSWRTFKHNPK